MKLFKKIGVLFFVAAYFLACQPDCCGCAFSVSSPEQGSHQTNSADDDFGSQCTCTNCLCDGKAPFSVSSSVVLPDRTMHQPHFEEVFALDPLLREIFIPPKLA